MRRSAVCNNVFCPVVTSSDSWGRACACEEGVGDVCLARAWVYADVEHQWHALGELPSGATWHRFALSRSATRGGLSLAPDRMADSPRAGNARPREPGANGDVPAFARNGPPRFDAQVRRGRAPSSCRNVADRCRSRRDGASACRQRSIGERGERPATLVVEASHAPVAQLDRASASGAEGHRFESCRARHPPPLAHDSKASYGA